MKNLLTLAVFSIITCFFYVNPAAAKEQETVIIGSNEVISSDLIKYGSSLIVSGRIDGDAYLAGGLVNFDGEVTGDLFVAGGKINLNGQVDGSLRVVGGDININSKIGRNLTVMGGNVQVGSITIPGSFTAAVGNLDSKANVGLGGKMAVGRASLDGTFGKDVKIQSNDELIFGPNTNIGGSLTYGGKKEARINKAAKITGKVNYDRNLLVIPENMTSSLVQGNYASIFQKIKFTTQAVSFVFTFVVGFILLRLIPDKSQKFMDLFEKNIVSSFGWGILLVVLSVIITGFLMMTVIGIPLGLLYVMIFITMMFLAKIISSLVLGRKLLDLLKLGERRGWALLIGLMIYYLISPIFVIGVVFRIFMVTTALGVFIVYYRNRGVVAETASIRRKITRGRKPRRR